MSDRYSELPPGCRDADVDGERRRSGPCLLRMPSGVVNPPVDYAKTLAETRAKIEAYAAGHQVYRPAVAVA